MLQEIETVAKKEQKKLKKSKSQKLKDKYQKVIEIDKFLESTDATTEEDTWTQALENRELAQAELYLEEISHLTVEIMQHDAQFRMEGERPTKFYTNLLKGTNKKP